MAKTPRASKAAPAARPPAAPELNTEYASRLVDPFEQLYMGVLRSNDPLLLERGQGEAAFYDDLERDGKVFSGLQKRRLALIGKAWQVTAVDDKAKGATEAADRVSTILKGIGFDQLCRELLDALLRGFAVAEIVWTARDGMIVPDRAVQRAQRRFRFVQSDEHKGPWLHLLTRDSMVTGRPVPERKFIVHRHNPKDDNPYGRGLGLQLYWPVFFKRKGIVAWNKLCDRFGSPTPHGKYPRGAGPREKDTLEGALRAMSSDGYLMTPEGMEIELLESKLSGNVTTQQALATYMDDWIAEVLTGQEPKASSGGALAAASEERQDVREDITQADSDLLSETLNAQLLAPLCDYNGWPRCQVTRAIKKEKDTREMAETDKAISDMGFELGEATVRERYGEGWTKKAAPPPVVSQPPGATAPGQPAVQFAEATLASTRDAIDDLVDAELQGWRSLVTPVRDPLQALIDDHVTRGATAQELLDALPGALATMDVDALANALARSAFATRLAGSAGIDPVEGSS